MRPDREGPGKLPRQTAAGGTRPGWLLPAAGFALALALRLWRLDGSCLWFDELFGLHAARHAWGQLPRFVALDLVHPPLFYLLLKVWTAAGGESVWWLRLLPAVVSSLAAVPVALLARELRLPARAAALALLLFAASGFLVKYAQEVRMYAPLLLFASCSLWLLARYCRACGEDTDARAGDGRRGAPRARRGRLVDLVALTAANLLLVYTHYFGWLLVLLELVFVAAWARGRLKSFAASVFVLAVCFAPWVWAVMSAAGAAGEGLQQNIGWAARPGARELFQPYLLLHEPFRFQRHSAEPAVLRLTVLLSLLIFAPALAALAVRELRRRLGHTSRRTPTVRGGEGDALRDESAQEADAAGRASYAEHAGPTGLGGFALRFLVFFSAVPVAAAFVLSQLLPQSVWGTRHLVVVAPAYLLLAAHAVTSVRPRWLSAAAHVLLGLWLLLAAAGWLARRPAPLVWCSWETLSVQLARAGAGSEKPVIIYAAEELAAYHLWHALDGREDDGGAGRFRVAVVKNLPGLAEDRAFFLPRGFDEVAVLDAPEALREDDFWLALRAPAADTDHPLLAALAERGYEMSPRFEATAQGQRVILVRARRR
ncbi:MAG TPA: glycosyltransferase family 39 protein [Pyrinomonadaceae bacterium]|nr:glycosyltransferase family 39 protein [Pyrinomonadaceae bacterium]